MLIPRYLGPTALNSLQGALGKTAGRSYKAAPRQLLQVDAAPNGASSSPTLSHASAHISKADAVHPLLSGTDAPDAAMAAHMARSLGLTEEVGFLLSLLFYGYWNGWSAGFECCAEGSVDTSRGVGATGAPV